MTGPIFTYDLADETATASLASQIAKRLRPGDVILLEGEIGAGKSVFGRAVIRALCGAETEVPSPTFTLVQTYETPDFEIWHSDLYRLSDTQEVVELGLTEAFATAVCLVEWPDRLGAYRPPRALTLQWQAQPTAHVCTATGDADWHARLGDLNA